MQRYICFLKNKINLSKNDIFLFLNEIEWEVGYSQNTGLFGALRLKDLPIIQINPYGVFFDFVQTVNDYSGFALMKFGID